MISFKLYLFVLYSFVFFIFKTKFKIIIFGKKFRRINFVQKLKNILYYITFSKDFLNICRKCSMRYLFDRPRTTFTCKLHFSYRDMLHHLRFMNNIPRGTVYNLATYSCYLNGLVNVFETEQVDQYLTYIFIISTFTLFTKILFYSGIKFYFKN